MLHDLHTKPMNWRNLSIRCGATFYGQSVEAINPDTAGGLFV